MLKVSDTWQSIYFSSLGFVTVIKRFYYSKKDATFYCAMYICLLTLIQKTHLEVHYFYVMSKIILFDAVYLTEIVLFYLLHFFYLNKQTKQAHNNSKTPVFKVCLGSACPFFDSSKDQPIYQVDCLSRTGPSQ